MPRAPLLVLARSPRRLAVALAGAALGLVTPLLVSHESGAQTVPAPYDCRSMDPTKWPPSSKPYFMLAVDTSGSMMSCTNPTGFEWPGASCPSTAIKNSCNLEPTRLNDAKCSMTKTIQAFSGEVNFGFSTYNRRLTGCSAGAVTDSCTAANGTCGGTGADAEYYSGKGCTIVNPPNATGNPGCGNRPDCATANASIYTGATINTASIPPIIGGGTLTLPGDNWLNGGGILVDMLKDPTWAPATQPTTNVPELLSWFDGLTDNSKELFAAGYTPLEGILRTAHQYYSAGWSSSWADNNYCAAGGPTIDHPSPIDPTQDRPCRSLNVILVTDGDETCGGTAANAAQALYKVGTVITPAATGVAVRVPIRTYVIGFAGATASALNAIADMGDDGTANNSITAQIANNEVQLSQALSNIISGAVSPETCDNSDNNCNGCIDEGSKLYCDRNKTARTLTYLNTAGNPKTVADCCTWATAADRTACLAAYTGSISGANPQGSQWFLPCWDPTTSAAAPETAWLCANPGETCDNLDNNCDQQVLTAGTTPLFSSNTVDENQTKCGSPAHCPVAETCDGNDNNCDNITDNAVGSGVPYSICPNNCQTVPEICNGCDDDCDGIADNGIADIACGFSPPANCSGVQHCPAVAVSGPGACIAGVTKPGTSQYTACSSTPASSDVTCDGLDDNCNGIIDENAPPTPCTNGFPSLVYKDVNPLSACVKGLQACHTTTCVGWIGPSQEVCDGLDNDCDGLVDAADPDLVGVGASCGSVQGICTKGLTACIGGVVVCTGGTQPQPEICDGKDNNCNGQTDEAPLTDGPAAGANGCWQNAGNTCTFNNLSWSAPSGGTCNGLGTLTAPCQAGSLVCMGAAKWACQGGVLPTAEVCDGTDNNCNGKIDGADPALTGVGAVCDPPGTVAGSACEGTTVCSSGKLTCNGAAPKTEVCNGVDDDCNGLVDAADPNLVGEGTTCGSGLGTCKTGTTACVNGATVCQGEVKPGIEVCDGLDNNCNGAIDDNVTDTPALLGCWNLAGSTCSGGGKTWSAPPGATCTGLGTLTSPCAAGTLVCSGLSKWVCQGGTLPATEVCDGVDNDCNGTADNGNPGGGAACGTAPSVLPCKKGTLTCVSGQLSCTGEIGPQPELCDGIDNDCDGTIDDGNPGGGASCGSSTGICKKGTTTCVSSAGPPPSGSIQCTGGVLPKAVEVCNGLDDDCNGLVDDNLSDAPPSLGCWNNSLTGCSWKNATWGLPAPGATCTGVGTLTSPCAAGTLVCTAGGWVCQGGTAPAPEACDGIDNNCNGTVDDGNPGGGAACGPTLGVCAPGGTIQCIGGKPVCQGAATPGPELCNGLDDNCNGIPDNLDPNLVGVGQICGSNVGACHTGVQACVINVGPPLTATIVCNGKYDGAPETCNGIDDDCNGIVDDNPTDAPTDPGCWNLPGTTCTDSTGLTWDHPPGATCTGLGTGAGALTSPCAAGAMICKKGAWECLGARVPTSTEICDGVDNNCNGQTDEGNPGGGATCGDPLNPGTAPCAKGTLTCVSGAISCVGEIKPSPEICDNIDNNCDGTVDNGSIPGTGVACTDKCGAGTRICVAGNLVCQTARTSTPEICNGIDDDCDGLVDNGVLADAPKSGQDGCWNVNLVTNAGSATGAACAFSSGTTPPVITTWDKPQNANCGDLGTLTSPCQTGRLSCVGAKGWTCIGGKLPGTEVCDGQDQDCNGVADDGDPGAGAACQVGVGTEPQCSGTVHCVNGALTCNAQAQPETCNGKDDDCDGVIDNGLPIGKACPAPFDPKLYPGDRTQGACRPGVLICDPAGSGQFICTQGVGPQPEICDGIDNDCDGTVDEPGAAPDGVDGTVDPGNPAQHFGDLCGSKVGECRQGHLACSGAKAVCTGGKGPQPEFCDCLDNNCDGTVDEAPAPGTLGAKPLCAGASVCVKNGDHCECASPCKTAEFPCPTGAECKTLSQSGSSKTGGYCVSDTCTDCAAKTVKDQCGPAGTLDSHGQPLPLCDCRANACAGPCTTTACGPGLACVPSGDFVGNCEPNTDCRFFFNCASGTVCNAGACVNDPCAPANACPNATDVCKPSATFDRARCVGSCADVKCGTTEHCVDGKCEPTGCTTPCPTGQVCLPTGADGGGTCGPSRCKSAVGSPACTDGSYCDPLTGSCGHNDPCTGVKCPSGQVCSTGECVLPPVNNGAGGTSSGGGTGAGGTSNGGGTGTGTDAGNSTGAGGVGNVGGGSSKAGGTGTSAGPPNNEAIGLATGGGGCRCDLPARGSSSRSALGFGALLVAVLATRRRARKEGGAA